MRQFGKVLKFELKAHLKNKAEVGTFLFLIVLIGIALSLPRITAAFKQDSSIPTDDPSSRPVMLIKAEEETQSERLQEAFVAAFPDYRVQMTDAEVEALKGKILSGDAECAFVMNGNTAFTYYVNNLSLSDGNSQIAAALFQRIYQLNAMVDGGMTPEQAAEAMNVQITTHEEVLGTNQFANYLYVYVMTMVLYMAVFLFGQTIAINVASEKSSRAMELLITSVKPTAMMFGKVVASCLAGFIELGALFGSAILFYSLNKEFWGGILIVGSAFNIPPAMIAYMLLFFVLGLLIYAFMYSAGGSIVSRMEDVSTSVMPISLFVIAVFIVVQISLAEGNVDNVLMKICSYFPLTSPFAMFARIAMGSVPFYEILISVVILIASVMGIGVLSAKVYRTGVLLYGTKPKIGAVLKAAWKA